jgi:DNA-binding response OmpR family regulator
VAGRPVKLLHVEDDEIQHRLTVFHLRKYDEFDFRVTWAESQTQAVRAFQSERQDLVILDYHLQQGNGLDCLNEIRALDPIVPIVALSASTDTEIAAKLIRAGADDFLCKNAVQGHDLRSAIQTALFRADLYHRQCQTRGERDISRLKILIHTLCERYLGSYDPEVFRLLNDIESTASRVTLSEAQRHAALDSLRAHAESCVCDHPELVRAIFRPLRLELEIRIGLNQQAPCQCGEGQPDR